MGSTERRIACLKIAASMLKPRDKDGEAPTADQLVAYADKLSSWAYRGEQEGRG